ncbi:MAG: alcohol dehydrogenase catalytic domain-containing protein [Candidatus Acidiferrales bacterium]
MRNTYRAMEVTSPGVFSLVERKIAVPSAGQVRIRVEACGVCHSDAATVEAQFPNLYYPRVPGHEGLLGVHSRYGLHARQVA